MDRLMNNHWFMKIVALLLALMLFMSVHLEAQPKKESGIFVPTTSTQTLKDIPVTGYFDTDQYVVTGIPQYVNVTLSGPINVIKSTQLQHDLQVYVDLRDYSAGTHQVKFKYKNISNELHVTVDPVETTVLIQQKVTKQFTVDVGLIRENMIKQGFSADKPVVKPSVVDVTGAKEEIDRISYVEARVDMENASDTIKQESKVAAYDQNGDVVNVEINPSVVNVTVPVTSPSKIVSFKLNQKGQLKDGLSIASIVTTPSEVTIYGPQDVLDKIDAVDGISLDLTTITGDTELEIPVPKPDGIKKVSPEKIKVTVNVDKKVKKTLTNIPISIEGLADNLTGKIINPSSGTMDIDVIGAKSVIDHLNPSDMRIFVNATGLDTGDHQVNLEVNGPENVSWVIPTDTVTMQISKKA